MSRLTHETAFNLAHAHVAKWEGGYIDHPNDPGGVTMYGISLMFLKSLGLVDGDIDGFVAFHPLTGLRVKFYQTDKSEIGTITEPESAGSRVEQQARINGITVFIIQ